VSSLFDPETPWRTSFDDEVDDYIVRGHMMIHGRREEDLLPLLTLLLVLLSLERPVKT